MKSIIAALALALLLPAGAAATTVHGQGSIALGAGTLAAKVNAKSGPPGDEPRGKLAVTLPSGTTYTTRVTCLLFAGDTVIVGGRVEPPAPDGFGSWVHGIAVAIRDNPRPTPDLFGPITHLLASPDDELDDGAICSGFDPGGEPGPPSDRGNFVVR
jgi:hypothetical protein